MSTKCRVIEGGLCEITQKYKKGVHNGIDLTGKNHTLAWEVAHSDGEVVGIKTNMTGFKNGSYGNYVKLKHPNGYYTLYAHGKYNSAKVKLGDKVKRGAKLQYMGNTGMSYGAHLHWEVRDTKDKKIDPTPYLNADLPNSGSDKKVNAYYRVRTKKYGWLPEVKNLEDYAGWKNDPITDIAVKVDKGSIWYQVHVKGGNWLPKVTGYNINDGINGYAGIGKPIDAVRIYYNTPSDIRPYKKAKYKVNNYDWQYDDERDKKGENFAGVYGVNITELRVTIE